MNEKEIKEKVKSTFNRASSGYDLPELKFFINSSRYLIDLMRLKGDENILDVCTGTGHAAILAAGKLTTGYVTGIDISDKMIFNANQKIKNMNNIKFICTDLDDFSDNDPGYDIVSCAFGIFFFPDMAKGLDRMKGFLRPEGKIFLSSFDTGFMEPGRSLFFERLKNFGVKIESSLWTEINSKEKFKAFLSKNGYEKVEIFKNQSGYYLDNADQWWKVILNTNLRNSLNTLSENEIEEFRIEHLNEINKLNKGKGIMLDVGVLYAEISG
jgi:ubiquinone/menaquinone biosynthesis C-methylase UbiE